MKLGLVTDETKLSFEEAVEFGLDHGLSAFEIRAVDGRRIPDFSPHTKSKIFDVLMKYGVDIPCISPGTFKVPFGSETLQQHVEFRFPLSLELAAELRADTVVVFAPFVPRDASSADVPAEVSTLLEDAAERAKEAGVILALEVEGGTYAPTGQATSDLLHRIDHPNLRINWDPGNAVRAGETVWPDGFESVKDLIHHVHVKDAVYHEDEGTMRFTYPGKGVCEWPSQLKGLKDMGYSGYLMIETHFGKQPSTTSKCIRRVQRMLENLG